MPKFFEANCRGIQGDGKIITDVPVFFFFFSFYRLWGNLSTEAVEGAALPLEGVDDVHGGDGLPAGVLGVAHRVADDGLKENLEDTAGLLVDEAGDALDTTPASQPADGGLGNALDVIPENLAVPLGSALSEALASLSASRHYTAKRE